MQRPSPHLSTSAGRVRPGIGANYWSRAGGPLMWRHYDGEVVDTELRTLREHGLTMTRSFFYWPDFHPEPHRIDEELCARYADFLDRHTAHGLETVPTFLVGHMSGENWDPAWRGDRDLYTDVWLVARQAWFAREMTRRFAGHPAVAGWLISNEMPIYGSPPGEPEADRAAVAAWAQLMVDAVRAGGGQQPVSLGDGAWGLENTGHDNGFRLRDTAELSDFLGPHVYRMEDDAARQHHAAAWACELTGSFGRPVVLEEFGLTSAFASGDSAARYYRQTLHNSLLAGATGWIAWNNTDYDALRAQPPYLHHAFEMHFGITDSAGRPKPPLLELRDFAALLERVEFGRCRRSDTDTALVLSSYLDTRYPFTRPEDREHSPAPPGSPGSRPASRTPRRPWSARATVWWRARGCTWCPQSNSCSPPAGTGCRSWPRAAPVYVSYSAGSHDEQRGPWYAHLDRMFGVRHGLEYGLVDPVEDDVTVLTLAVPLGGLAAGSELRFASAAGTASGRVRLPVEPDGAEVLAADGRGRPTLLRRRVGRGAVVLCVYPLEYLAACTPRVNPEAGATLYDALATEAGVRRPVTVRDPRVAVDRLVHEDGHAFVWL
ncbi:cellulase family glycosylhydrolase, partial [Streptomyces sp. SM12]|uniref:glycoside hydrolase 5 family protein n=1 Tax=Streptomyces sp. SM12 TaxID=1071602 RepID=UPI00215665E3